MFVSVVIPTRDRRPALERSLASVDAQSHRDLELLVVDDGSTDDTAAWLARERPSVRVLAGGGSGAGGARNRGLAAAQGELVAFLDDDDRWRPSYLATQVAWLAAHPDVDLAYADHVEVDAAGRVGEPDVRPLAGYDSELIALLAEGGIHTMSVVVCRRSAYVRWGGFDESLRVVQDLEWYARLLAGGARLARLPQALVERSVPGGLVSSYRDWQREERAVHARVLAAAAASSAQRRRVRAARALLFGRIGLTNGDLRFGAVRLAEALAAAPAWTLRLAVVRLARNLRRGRRAAAPAWRAVAAKETL